MNRPPLPNTVALRHANLAVDLAPEAGGAIARFYAMEGDREIDLLRPATRDAVLSKDSRRMASFPMVPFAGPLVDGQFSFGERTYQIAHNFPGRPIALHGDGWQHAWTVRRANASAATLCYTQDGKRFPFRYSAEQAFSLRADCLRVTLAIRNGGREPMPAGIGFHPFFPKSPDAHLQTSVQQVWRRNGNGSVEALENVPSDISFSTSRPVHGLDLNHAFAGWARCALVQWPERGFEIVLTAHSPLDSLVLFIPRDRDCFCVEPVSNAPDGFNRLASGLADSGVRTLMPGEVFSGSMSLTIRPISGATERGQ